VNWKKWLADAIKVAIGAALAYACRRWGVCP
jgi:hypothetical protein